MNHVVSIVEDDTAVRQSLRLVLELNGYDVAEFESGAELLASADLERTRCIVMDVQLPGETGLKTMERLRQRAIETPVVVVSARPTEAVRREAGRLNALAFFEKPVPVGALLETIGDIGAARV